MHCNCIRAITRQRNVGMVTFPLTVRMFSSHNCSFYTYINYFVHNVMSETQFGVICISFGFSISSLTLFVKHCFFRRWTKCWFVNCMIQGACYKQILWIKLIWTYYLLTINLSFTTIPITGIIFSSLAIYNANEIANEINILMIFIWNNWHILDMDFIKRSHIFSVLVVTLVQIKLIESTVFAYWTGLVKFNLILMKFLKFFFIYLYNLTIEPLLYIFYFHD